MGGRMYRLGATAFICAASALQAREGPIPRSRAAPVGCPTAALIQARLRRQLAAPLAASGSMMRSTRSPRLRRPDHRLRSATLLTAARVFALPDEFAVPMAPAEPVPDRVLRLWACRASPRQR
jgi:hypothetical protein